MNNGNFNNQNWSQPNYSQNSWQPRMNTNRILVTSLDEALMRTNTPNSDMIYFHQDEPIIYRVMVNEVGRKMWQQFNYTIPNPDANVPATKADLQSIIERIGRLEQTLSPKAKEETTNAESNG